MDDLGRHLEDALESERNQKPADVHAVLRRGRRLRLQRIGGLAAAGVALLAFSGFAITSFGGEESARFSPAGSGSSTESPGLGSPSGDIVGESPFEPDPEREVLMVPDGPRYEVAQGKFDDTWGADSGKKWRLTVWGDHVTHCWEFSIGDGSDKETGLSGCEEAGSGPYATSGEIEHVSVTFHIPAGGEGDHEQAIVGGVLSQEVDVVEFGFGELGGKVSVKSLDAPKQTTIQQRYYLNFIPPVTCGKITALDKEGRVLAVKPLVRGGCD